MHVYNLQIVQCQRYKIENSVVVFRVSLLATSAARRLVTMGHSKLIVDAVARDSEVSVDWWNSKVCDETIPEEILNV